MPNLSLINDLSLALKSREPLARKDNRAVQAKASAFDRALVSAERRAQATDKSHAEDRLNASKDRAKDDSRRLAERSQAAARPEPQAIRNAAPERHAAPERAEPAPRREDSVQEPQRPASRASSTDKPRDAIEKPLEDTASKTDTENTYCADKDAAPVDAVVQATQPAVVAAAVVDPALAATKLAALLLGADGEAVGPDATSEADAEAQTVEGSDAVPTASLSTVAATASSSTAPVPSPKAADPAVDKTAVSGVPAGLQAGAPSLVTGSQTSGASLNGSVSAQGSSPSLEDTSKTASKGLAAKDETPSTSCGALHELATAVEQVKAFAPVAASAPVQSAVTAADAAALVKAGEMTKASDPARAMMQADAPVPLQAVAVEIGMRAMRGSKEFSIRLDPEDLGRVDIRLEISDAGQVQAKLVVDRVETLQLLQRDAKTLERAFEQAGLKTNPDGLQFSLRDEGQQNRNANREQAAHRMLPDDKNIASPMLDDSAMRPAIFRRAATGALDIRI